MYRMYEAVMHYGEAIKAIMNEELGEWGCASYCRCCCWRCSAGVHINSLLAAPLAKVGATVASLTDADATAVAMRRTLV